MRKLILTMVLMFSTAAGAQGIFPHQPVEMKPGYGANGAGLHSGVPYGVPGNDCVINPVSMTHMKTTQTITEIHPGTIITIPATVLFDFDMDFVRPEGEVVLSDTVYAALVRAGVLAIDVIGHTDAKGTEEYNDDLGLRRAGAVAAVLIALGFDKDGVTVHSGGELSPIAPNTLNGEDNPAGRQENRRVELLVKSVQDDTETRTETVIVGRNPQVFHRLSSNSMVQCSGGFNGYYDPNYPYYRR